jgi:hypothetical protein
MRRLAFLFACGSCVPNLGDDDAVVSAPRILAVRAEPAEAKPGSTIEVTALVATPESMAPAPTIAWNFCIAPKALTEDNVVSNTCLDDSSLVPAGIGMKVTVMTPSRGCSVFGPDAPPGGLRPRDPDGTGGYYQPLRVDLVGAPQAFALLRITCGVANATSATASAFAGAYVPNNNPSLLSMTSTQGGVPIALDAIAAGARVDLTASWPAGAVETYAYYDAASDTIGSKRESMSIAWYASSGRMDRESTGRAEDDPTTSSSNTWTAPMVAGTAQLWVVLRDSRGGVDFASNEAIVRP